MTRAGIYVRISDDREGRAVGVARQEEDCRALGAARGWTVAEVYSDNDISATSGKTRRAYRRMLKDLEEGRLDALVAYSSSRFYRRVRDLDELAGLLEQRHAEVATVTSGRIDLSTADGRMTARLLAVIDQGEAERIGERSARAKADLKAAGRWLGGGATAYGYERVKDERGKVTAHRVREDEAAVLRELARRALSGESLNSLARDLNARGVPTSQGRRWQPSKIRTLLTSPFHAGRFPDGTPGTWPAIFTEDEHRVLRVLFPGNPGVGRGHGDHPARAYALSGLAYCSECERKLLGSGGSYKCQVRNGGCGRTRMAARGVDAIVRDAALAREQTWELDPARSPSGSTPDQSDGLAAQLRELEARRAALAEDYADGSLGRDDFRRATEAVSRRITAVEARVREQAPRPGVSFATLLEDPSPLDWNELLSQVVERVVVRPAALRGRNASAEWPDRVTIEWR